MKDISAKVFQKTRYYRLNWLGFFSTLFMKLKLSLLQVDYGKGVRFWGSAYFLRFPGSSISIGNLSSFRSDPTSNMIGVNRKCIITTHSKNAMIVIGNNCGLSGTAIGAKEKIVLGNNVLCGANTLITDFDWHGIDPARRRTYSGDSKPITIGDNVFIGYGSVILKGVTIGENSVIGANSTVTQSIPANCIAAGNPAKMIKSLASVKNI